MSFTNLPLELQIMITDSLSDPCDLLAVRLTHPRLNSLLSERFSREFPRSTYMRGTSYASIDSMLFWAAEHNHLRFVDCKLLRPGAWILDASTSWNGVRQASMNAVRHGNEAMMFRLVDVAAITQGLAHVVEDLFGECLEVAITENQLSIAKRLIDDGVAGWDNGVDSCIVMQLIKFHHPELLEYMEDSQEVKTALEDYYDPLLEFGDVSGWCQRILCILLKSGYMREGLILESFVERIEATNRRNCEQECEVWFGGNRKVDKVEMIQELRKMQRKEHIGT